MRLASSGVRSSRLGLPCESDMDWIARLPLPSSGGDCNAAQGQRRMPVGVSSRGAEVWTRRLSIPRESKAGRPFAGAGAGACSGCVDEKPGSRRWNTDGNPRGEVPSSKYAELAAFDVGKLGESVPDLTRGR